MALSPYRSIVAVATTALACSTCCSAETQSGSQLGRVKIAEHEFGKTVVTSNGQLFRGTSVLVYRYGHTTGKTAHIHDDAYWQLLEDHGVNAVRMACFDPWQHAHGAEGTSKPYPHADLHSEQEVTGLLKDYDDAD